MNNLSKYFDSIDVSTRPKRRRVVALVVKLVDRIHFQESSYLNRIPDNLQTGDAFAAAEDSVTYLEEALAALHDAYYD